MPDGRLYSLPAPQHRPFSRSGPSIYHTTEIPLWDNRPATPTNLARFPSDCPPKVLTQTLKPRSAVDNTNAAKRVCVRTPNISLEKCLKLSEKEVWRNFESTIRGRHGFCPPMYGTCWARSI